jgi:uncharacterized protein YndB with AHSA1/START domain
MNAPAHHNGFGMLTEPATLKIERLLPGPAERIWAYLVDSEQRAKWLASGHMGKVGTDFELVWRNDELTNPPGKKPEGFGEEHRATCRVLEFDPPRRLAFTFGNTGEVSFELTPLGDDVLLTVIHSRLPNRNTMLMVGAGWHMHLDILVARTKAEQDPEPFWDGWVRLKGEYDKRLPV